MSRSPRKGGLSRNIDELFPDLDFVPIEPPDDDDDLEPLQGSPSVRPDSACEEDAGNCELLPHQKHVRLSQRMLEAMAKERAQGELGPASALFGGGGRARPPEFVSQLALKRGKQLRGGDVRIDTSDPAVMVQLLSHNPDMARYHRAPQSEIDSHQHWFDELENPSGMALMPTLDRGQVMRFVNQSNIKQGLVDFLTKRRELSKLKASQAMAVNPGKTGALGAHTRPLDAARSLSATSKARRTASLPKPPAAPTSPDLQLQEHPVIPQPAVLTAAGKPGKFSAVGTPTNPLDSTRSLSARAHRTASSAPAPPMSPRLQLPAPAYPAIPPPTPQPTDVAAEPCATTPELDAEQADELGAKASLAAFLPSPLTEAGKDGKKGAAGTNVYYGQARRLALRVKAQAAFFAVHNRIDGASTDLTQHLKAIRPYTAPARAPSVDDRPTTDWDVVLGSDGPDDGVPDRAAFLSDKFWWDSAVKNAHLQDAVNLRAALLANMPFYSLDLSGSLQSELPDWKEACTLLPRSATKAKIAKLGRRERPRTEFARGRRPSARGGSPYTSAELLALQGRTSRPMTLHGKALRSVDGSLVTENEDSEQRWAKQVEEELQRMSDRLLRLNAVHRSGQAQPRLTEVYERRERLQSDLTPPAERALLRQHSRYRCQGGIEVARCQVWTPGVRQDEVKLDHCVVSNAQIAALVMLLTRQKYRDLRTVRSLVLADTGLVDEQFAMALTGLDGLAELHDVDLSHNKLTGASAKLLTALVADGKCKQLRSLDLGHNPLGSACISDLAESLFATSLVRLGLAGVGLDHRGARGLAFLLDNSLVLEELDVSWNRLGPAGCALLADALRYNHSVVSVDLSHNALGPDGGACIGEVLFDNRTLRTVKLANNRLSLQSCTVLAAGMRATRALHFLDLAHNPLGLDGATQMLECIARRYAVNICMQDCNFSKMSGTDASAQNVHFDVKRPNASYRLDLKNPAHYQVACTLARRWRSDGPSCWKRASLNGKDLKLTAAMSWPERMPRDGLLEVDFSTEKVVPDASVPVLDEQFEALYASNLDPQAPVTDVFRASFCQVMASSLYLTSQQAISALACFSSVAECVLAAMALLGALMDPYNLPSLVESLDSEAAKEVLGRIGVLAGFNPANPTGSYVLNLSQIADATIAQRLLKCWCTEIRIGVCRPAQLEACWRHVVLNGQRLDPFTLEPLQYTLPREGVLTLDYVSYDVPVVKHADLICQFLSPRARIFRVKPTLEPEREEADKDGARKRKKSGRPRGSGAGVPSPRPKGSASGLWGASMSRSSNHEQSRDARIVAAAAALDVPPSPQGEDRSGQLAAPHDQLQRMAHPPGIRDLPTCAYEMVMQGRLREMQSKVEEVKADFLSLADDPAAAESSQQSEAEKEAERLQLRASMNFSKLGVSHVRLLTERHLHILLRLLTGPRIPPTRTVQKLLTDVTERRLSGDEVERTLIALGQPEELHVSRGPLSPQPRASVAGESSRDALDLLLRSPEASNIDVAPQEVVAAAAQPADTAESKPAKPAKGPGKRVDTAADEPVFPPSPPMGLKAKNVPPALELLRILAVDYFVTSHMVDLISELFDDPLDKVRVVQCFWARILDRSRVPHLLRSMPRATQISLGHKLGWKTVYQPASPDLAYELDLSRPDDNDVGARLFRAGVDIRGRCVNNLLVSGKPHVIKEENYLLYGVVEEKALSKHSDTPVICFDYWTIRKDVMHDRRTAAACILQNLWRKHSERKKRAARAAARQAKLAAKAALLAAAEPASASLEAERGGGGQEDSDDESVGSGQQAAEGSDGAKGSAGRRSQDAVPAPTAGAKAKQSSSRRATRRGKA